MCPPGGGTAVYNSSGLAYYRHADWLGSSRLATHTTQSSQASYYYDGAYAPYGESYAGSGTTDLNFTGQNQDTVVGLFDFLYREYNSPQGRWAGPDPAGLEAVNMSNPQSWNRYSYIGNSPLNAVDPLGLHEINELATYNDDFDNPNAVTYYLDGIQVSAKVAQNWLSVGAAAQCPKNDCTNITLQSNGEFHKKEYSNPVVFQCNGESSGSCYPTHWISVYLGKAGDSLPSSVLCVHMGGTCDIPVSAGGQQLFQGNRNLWKSANGTMIDLTEAYAAVPLIVAAPEVAVTAAATAETYGVPVFAISLWVQQNWNTLMNARKIWNWYEQCQTKDIC